MISRANCKTLTIWKFCEPVYEVGILQSLDGIQFPHLTELRLAGIRMKSLEILTLLEAPSLIRLKIEECNVTNTKLFHKTNFDKIKYLFMIKQINQDE